jgi:hypothetical protein
MLHSASNSIHENDNDDIEQPQQQQQQPQQPYPVTVNNMEEDQQQQQQRRPARLKQLVLLQQASERMQQSVVQGTRSISLSTQMAATATLAQVLTVVQEIGSNPLETEQRENEAGGVVVKGEANDAWITKMDERGVIAVGVAAFFAACWSFIAVVGQLADVSSLTTLLLSPTVIVQRTKLNKLGSLRELHNELRNMASQLATENVHMHQSVTSLESHLQRLNTVESQLTSLAKDSGKKSVEKLVHVVEEHGHVQAELKRVLKEDVTHQLFAALLQSDVNSNYRLSSPDETGILEQRLANVQGVIFNQANFRKLVQSSDGTLDLTLTDAANLARELQRDEDIPDAEKVFIFRPLDVLKHKTSTTTTATAAAAKTTTMKPTPPK